MGGSRFFCLLCFRPDAFCFISGVFRFSGCSFCLRLRGCKRLCQTGRLFRKFRAQTLFRAGIQIQLRDIGAADRLQMGPEIFDQIGASCQLAFGGFQFTGGRDFSKFKYLVLNLAAAPTSNNWSLRLFDGNDYFGAHSELSVGKKTRVVVDLQNTKKTNGVKLDVSHIYILGLWDRGNSPIKIKDIYVTNNADYSPEVATGIEDIAITRHPSADTHVFNLNGQRVVEPKKGQIYICNGKKIINN